MTFVNFRNGVIYILRKNHFNILFCGNGMETHVYF